MSSRRREDRSTTADAYRTWQSSGKYQTDYETERRRHRSSTLPANPQESRHYPTQDPRYHDSRQSSRPHRKDQTHYYPPASYPPPAAGPSTGRTSTHHVARQHSTSGGYPYHQSSSYHTSAPSQPPPASQGTVGAPMPSSSRRPYQEALDPRVHPQTVSTTAPAVQASYDKGSGAAEAARSAKQRTTHSSTQPASAQPSHVVWVPPQQEMGSTRRHKGGDRDNERGRDRDREHERGKTRETERTPAEVEKERHISRSERHRERDRPSEPERYKDYREPSKSRHRRESDSEGIAHADRLNGHRRHRTEDSIAPTSSSRRQLAEDPRVPSTRRHAETAQNPINSAQAHLTADPQAEGVDSAQRGEQSSNAPPAPRVMPVYLPTKASKPSRSHHDKRLSVAAQAQGAHSGSDTERPSGRHRMERTHSGAAVQRNDGYAPSTTRERGGRDAQPDAREDAKEGKFGSYNARQPRNQVNGIPPRHSTQRPSVAQFVSIRAGQGPSDPQAEQFVLTQRPPLSSSRLRTLELILTKSPALMLTNSLPHVLVLSLTEWSHLGPLTPLAVMPIKLRLPRCHARFHNKPVATPKRAWRTPALPSMLPPILHDHPHARRKGLQVLMPPHLLLDDQGSSVQTLKVRKQRTRLRARLLLHLMPR
ncbi:hypothetical protein BKA83DRAFT_460676 [Pisolithus microcarpus]|nr:hypothetical protein BKA83DRAFT_460676 [Pisolithus microcarpus]